MIAGDRMCGGFVLGPAGAELIDSPTSPQVSLESLAVDWQHFSNSGDFQGPARGVQWTVTVTGSSSGLVGTASDSANAASGQNTISFSAPLALANTETYDVKIFVATTGGSGNNTGFDGLSFSGEIVPEPGSVALLGLGALAVLFSRRRG